MKRQSMALVSGTALTNRVYASGTTGARNGPESLLQAVTSSADATASPIRFTFIRTAPPRSRSVSSRGARELEFCSPDARRRRITGYRLDIGIVRRETEQPLLRDENR